LNYHVLDKLQTPALLLDVAKVDANIRQMQVRVESKNVSLRPHVKTCKSVDVIRRMFPNSAGIGPITVSTIKEAEWFAQHGYTDILYAVSIVPAKLARVAKIQQQGVTVHLILDDVRVAEQLSKIATDLGQTFSILIEIDCDGHRAGLTIDQADQVVQLAKLIAKLNGLHFSGLMTHAGESYECTTTTGIEQLAILESECICQLATEIEKAGVSCPIRSVGSSATVVRSGELDGITEVRAGVFMFWDLFQSNLGVCSIEDIAMSVWCTVISHRPDKGWLIVDAGGLALSKDRGTSGQAKDYGFGWVCDANGEPISTYLVDKANQEHGIISNHDGKVDFDRFPIGTRLRILPNHACMTAAAHTHYHALIDEQCETWPRINGW